ncbi:MAG: GNAT family N-acetyltransferase [Verrucomicrobium sp.]|nr:GNAT family N-acetyltransferase [Verrucomicrobium sp.]
MADSSSPESPTIRHNEADQRFETAGTSEPSVLEYELEAGRILFTHTFVPPALRGQGVAADLVKEGFAYARKEGLKVVPLCSYVAQYLKRHREYDDLR